jgi:hypothetical protein
MLEPRRDNLLVSLGNYSPKEGEYFLNKEGICHLGILAKRYYHCIFLFILIVVQSLLNYMEN